MNIDLALALGLFAFVSSITPGPNNLMLMASGTNYGFIRTAPHMFGVAFGFVVMLVLVGVGLINVFDQYPVSYLILKTVSVIYLVFLSWKIATAAAPSSENPDSDGISKPMTFLQAALFQWVNPKAWAMALTAISAYTPVNPSIGIVLVVGFIFGVINLPSVAVWVLLGTQIKRFLNNAIKLRTFNYSAAVLLVASVYPILFTSG